MRAFLDYYRCPDEYCRIKPAAELSPEPRYFRIGPEIICYGRTSLEAPISPEQKLAPDVGEAVAIGDSVCELPFDLTEIFDNLRLERYPRPMSPVGGRCRLKDFVKGGYYFVRPLLPVSVRRHMQKLYLRGWRDLSFPKWPVDCTVEQIGERAVMASLQATGLEEMPFIWFWPNGHQGCLIMTHDVETETGRDFCSQLMDIDESFGMRASFQIVPEKRYRVSEGLLAEIRRRGFEVNIHGLNHDGNLFSDRTEFLKRAGRINRYAKELGAMGFRSPVLYRNIDWYDALEFTYDMSVPNVGHLDPQRGGCCTVMPYFIGQMVELPLTTTQDYALFHFIGDFSIELWKTQITAIANRHGMVSLLIHPDYVIAKRERTVFRCLLQFIEDIVREKNMWVALPKDVAAWWKTRRDLRITREGGEWRIHGVGKEAARLAYAFISNGRLTYRIAQSASC